MLDPEVRQETVTRLGRGIDRIEPSQIPGGELHPEAEPFVEALWEAWITATLYLVAFGFPHRSLCDAAGEMVTVKEEAGGRLLTTA